MKAAVSVLFFHQRINHYFFQRSRSKHLTPLAVAGGGGGLGLGQFIDNGRQHGQGVVNATQAPVTGKMYGIQ